MDDKAQKIRVGVLGASGYTGAELLRLLHLHPNVTVAALTADRHAGKPLSDVFPQFYGVDLPTMVAIDAVDFSALDAVFCCLPHGTTQQVIKRIRTDYPKVRVFDLSADFRLADVETYAKWYGEHQAPELQPETVYGLVEAHREKIRGAMLVAVPGCYPTSAQLPLIPLLKAGLIEADDIIVDAKSGVSGAGRSAKEASLFTEVAEGIHAYGVANHRHRPEIEQGLGWAAGRKVTISFTPHLMPMSRGILSTIYVKAKAGVDAAILHACLAEAYGKEPFIRLLPLGEAPQTRHVRGTNQLRIGVFADTIPGRVIIFGAEDNLTKGASGQALQCFNVAYGLPESTALSGIGMFP
ncbi:N-acetyl-gamma-glutamyl-phosphate reductase [Radicibacter daui]|uniref:N-acetyl-gamma-glutamyl-phosphate reductase n=1 Tax=Radicibacter daui TaxID=3064829 RepID=UPI004046942F